MAVNHKEGVSENNSKTKRYVPKGVFQKANQDFLNNLNKPTPETNKGEVDYDYSNYVYTPKVSPKTKKKTTQPRWLRYLIYQITLLAKGLLYNFAGRLCLFSMIGGIWAYNHEDTRNVGLLFILVSSIMFIGMLFWLYLKNKEEPFDDM